MRYILTEAGNVVVDGILASVRSTGGGPLEELPFATLEAAWPGVLQSKPVAAALATVLDSPILRAAQALLRRFASLKGLACPIYSEIFIAPRLDSVSQYYPIIMFN